MSHKNQKTSFWVLGFYFCLNLWIITFSTGLHAHEKLYPPFVSYLHNHSDSQRPKLVFKSRLEMQAVALTFDDGPTKNTKKLTGLLQELKCPATFFVVAKNLSSSSVQPYLSDQFEIGLHGYEHINYSKHPFEVFENHFKLSQDAFSSLSINLQWFRPPYGVFNKDILDTLDHNYVTCVLWSLDSLDWLSKDNEEILHQVLDQVEGGDIILFHEKVDLTLLTQIIDGIREKGFKLATLSQLLNN